MPGGALVGRSVERERRFFIVVAVKGKKEHRSLACSFLFSPPLSLSHTHAYTPSQMLCTVEKIPPVPELPPLPPLQPGGPTTRSTEDDGIADVDVDGMDDDDRCCAAAADSARTRSCRMASASSSWLPMASRKREQPAQRERERETERKQSRVASLSARCG